MIHKNLYINDRPCLDRKSFFRYTKPVQTPEASGSFPSPESVGMTRISPMHFPQIYPTSLNRKDIAVFTMELE